MTPITFDKDTLRKREEHLDSENIQVISRLKDVVSENHNTILSLQGDITRREKQIKLLKEYNSLFMDRRRNALNALKELGVNIIEWMDREKIKL